MIENSTEWLLQGEEKEMLQTQWEKYILGKIANAKNPEELIELQIYFDEVKAKFSEDNAIYISTVPLVYQGLFESGIDKLKKQILDLKQEYNDLKDFIEYGLAVKKVQLLDKKIRGL